MCFRLAYRLTAQSSESGLLAKEIVPVSIPQRKGKPDRVVEHDEEYLKADFEKFGNLKPVFKKDEDGGTITAANAPGAERGGAGHDDRRVCQEERHQASR